MTAYNSRPLATLAELRRHHAGRHSRDLQSSDGYDDIEAAHRDGWHEVPSWGRDGWNLGNWPYVIICTRDQNGAFELLTIVEGDHDVYSFDTQADRDAAIDYLFLWYAAAEDWAPIAADERPRLDAGEVVVAELWRGPYSTARSEAGRS